MSTTLTPPPQPQPQMPPPQPLPEAPKLNADGTVAKPWYKREFYVGKAVKIEEVMNFSRQMASFLRAGVPILDSLGVVAEENASKKMQEVCTDIQRRLRAGSSFGGAIAVHTKVFPGYYIAVCRAAELTGQLDDALDQLAGYLERDAETRRELKSSLTYPVIVFFLAIAAMIIMAVYVLPKFRDLYSSLDAKLPLPTRMLLGFTNFMSEWWWLIALLAVAALLVAFAVLGGMRGKERRDTLILRLPVVGELMHLVCVERFCSVLATLVHTGVPLPDAVAVSADSTNNRVFQTKLLTVRDAMMRGDGLARPIQASGLFPPAARQMIRVGESTGSLDAQLHSAATFYERELKYRLKRFTDMFEPAILLVVGGAVAFVAIAQISAMYSIYHQVKV
jgi:type IV pilus assembly protein PilC